MAFFLQLPSILAVDLVAIDEYDCEYDCTIVFDVKMSRRENLMEYYFTYLSVISFMGNSDPKWFFFCLGLFTHYLSFMYWMSLYHLKIPLFVIFQWKKFYQMRVRSFVFLSLSTQDSCGSYCSNLSINVKHPKDIKNLQAQIYNGHSHVNAWKTK